MRPNWFVGLPCPPGTWFERVRERPPPEGFRLFHPADLHATVAFLGPVGEPPARAAFALSGLWPGGALDASLAEVVPMGPRGRYSALSAQLGEGRERVEAGIGACRDAMLAAAGAPPERRAVRAHVTLARPGRRAGTAARRAGLEWARTLALAGARWPVVEIALYTWAADRRERLFRVVERRPIARSPYPDGEADEA